MMHDFHLLEEDMLKQRAQDLIDLGTQEDEGIKTTYLSYRLEEFNKCIFTIFEGKVETEQQNAQFYQYTTTINGFTITVTYRAYDGADYEAGKQLLDQIVHTLNINEVKEGNIKTNIIMQMIPPALLVIGFVGFAIFLFVRQIRKNKQEEAEAEAAKKESEQ